MGYPSVVWWRQNSSTFLNTSALTSISGTSSSFPESYSNVYIHIWKGDGRRRILSKWVPTFIFRHCFDQATKFSLFTGYHKSRIFLQFIKITIICYSCPYPYQRQWLSYILEKVGWQCPGHLPSHFLYFLQQRSTHWVSTLLPLFLFFCSCGGCRYAIIP